MILIVNKTKTKRKRKCYKKFFITSCFLSFYSSVFLEYLCRYFLLCFICLVLPYAGKIKQLWCVNFNNHYVDYQFHIIEFSNHVFYIKIIIKPW